MMGRASDGRMVHRPLSPHLMDYRLQFTTVLSGLHRITGVGLGIGTLLLTWWLVAAATSDRAFAWVQWFLGTPIGILCCSAGRCRCFSSVQRHPPSGLGLPARLRARSTTARTPGSCSPPPAWPCAGLDHRPCDLVVRNPMPDANDPPRSTSCARRLGARAAWARRRRAPAHWLGAARDRRSPWCRCRLWFICGMSA